MFKIKKALVSTNTKIYRTFISQGIPTLLCISSVENGIISWLLFFNNKFYRRSGLAVDHDIHKRRNAEQLKTDRRHEAARDRDRLDRLVGFSTLATE